MYWCASLYIAVLPSAAAQIPPAADQEHSRIDVLGRPTYGYVKFEPSYDHGAVYHIDCQGYKLQSESCLGAACAGYGKEEYLSSDCKEI